MRRPGKVPIIASGAPGAGRHRGENVNPNGQIYADHARA